MNTFKRLSLSALLVVGLTRLTIWPIMPFRLSLIPIVRWCCAGR